MLENCTNEHNNDSKNYFNTAILILIHVRSQIQYDFTLITNENIILCLKL